MRTPTNFFTAMFMGMAALIFGLTIAVVITAVLPDVIGILANLSTMARTLVHWS
jgi:hypothetical protein